MNFNVQTGCCGIAPKTKKKDKKNKSKNNIAPMKSQSKYKNLSNSGDEYDIHVQYSQMHDFESPR